MAPRTAASKKKWATRQQEPLRAHPKLTDEDMKNLSSRMREVYHWNTAPRDFQLDGVRAQLEGVDAIIQAPTGAGKTAIAAGPHLWPGNEGKTTIMVSPLLSLEDEMVHTFKTDYGLDAIAIQGKNGACSPLVIKAILQRQYRIILVSPEMLQSRTFVNRIMRNTAFMRHVISLFVDEAHCISHWGADFRKKYASLGIARAFLARGTPVIAVTATLTPRVRRDIHVKLNFPKRGSRFFNTGNDRPNVSIVVRAAQHAMNSFEDLNFVIPTVINGPLDIPKTYIYVDNISVGSDVVDFLVDKVQSRLRRDGTAYDSDHTLPSTIIRPFNATFSQPYREEAMQQFRDGRIRVLVCTDAAGMGCNISDIDVVVQWKLPATLSNFIQRAGRAARGWNRTGLAVLIVERSAYSGDITKDPVEPVQKSKGNTKGKAAVSRSKVPQTQGRDTKASAEYARAHGLDRGGTDKKDSRPKGVQPQLQPDADDEGLLTFVQSVTCRRRVWATAYDAESYLKDPSVPCCDICSPSLLDRTRPGTLSRQNKAKQQNKGTPDSNVQLQLDDWREAVFLRDHQFAQFDATAILDDTTITHLASIGPVSRNALADILKGTWLWWDVYGEELGTFMVSLPTIFTPVPKKSAKSKRKEPHTPLDDDTPPTRRSRTCLPSTGQSTSTAPSSHSEPVSTLTPVVSEQVPPSAPSWDPPNYSAPAYSYQPLSQYHPPPATYHYPLIPQSAGQYTIPPNRPLPPTYFYSQASNMPAFARPPASTPTPTSMYFGPTYYPGAPSVGPSRIPGFAPMTRTHHAQLSPLAGTVTPSPPVVTPVQRAHSHAFLQSPWAPVSYQQVPPSSHTPLFTHAPIPGSSYLNNANTNDPRDAHS
ncbi:P-loop containing nucleoside triphosphate hydrolase protein [Amylocystis lapponica]|nr:P-loop containing nucleoside triphosphate hydrolase protein [Amylocystis lapponica]